MFVRKRHTENKVDVAARSLLEKDTELVTVLQTYVTSALYNPFYSEC